MIDLMLAVDCVIAPAGQLSDRVVGRHLSILSKAPNAAIVTAVSSTTARFRAADGVKSMA